jgi:sec-independent protein translocase protein TatC
MPLWDHLGELRRRLTVIVVALLVAAVVLYMFSDKLALFLVQPVDADPNFLHLFDPMSAFGLRFKVSLFFGAIVTSPIWIWQLMAFFLPALKPNERKWVVPTFAIGAVLFIIGNVFCYLIILHTAFGWMISQGDGWATTIANAQSYINMIMLFELGFGIAFELPLIVFYLMIFNIIPYKKLRHSWRTVYIVLMVVCAVVTPDASPVTMILMFIAMAILYEISMFAARLVLNGRIRKQQLAEQQEESDS